MFTLIETHLFIFSVILGLLIGSFLNVVILRIPTMLKTQWLDECLQFLQENNNKNNPNLIPIPEIKNTPNNIPKFNLITPASHCPQCKHPISALENIPVISYVFLLGRCRACALPIPLRYPLVEIFTAIITVITVMHFGLTPQAGFALLLVWPLIAASFIDIDHQILPDDITLPVLWLGLLANTFGLFTNIQSAILGAIFGYLSLWTVYWVFKLITQKEGMGYGDFKLLALLGAWLGWQSLPLIILLSSLVGSVVGVSLILYKKNTRSTPIPFGPYLALAGFIALIWGEQINALYMRYLLS